MDQEITLDLRELLSILQKRMKIICIITILATAASAVVSFYVIKPVYQAQTSIIVGDTYDTKTQKLDANDIMMYQKLMKTYSEIAKSRAVAEKAISSMQHKVTTEELLKSLTVTPQADTQILMLSVQNGNPEAALEMVNAVTKAFMEEGNRIYPTGNVQIMDKPLLPQKPVKPNKKLNIAIAFFLGLMVSIGISLLLEYLDSTIKTEQDVEKYLQLPILGIIPKNIEQT